jgi:hypothetical protein
VWRIIDGIYWVTSEWLHGPRPGFSLLARPHGAQPALSAADNLVQNANFTLPSAHGRGLPADWKPYGPGSYSHRQYCHVDARSLYLYDMVTNEI